MKKLYIILFLMATGFHVASSQNSQDHLESFRVNILPQYNVYFTAAELNSSGQLVLSAEKNYYSLSGEGKTTVMDKLVKSWQESLIIVQQGTRRELWGFNSETGKALQIDEWDLENKVNSNISVSSKSKVAQHPWFAYFGLQEQFDSFKNLNMGLNARLGFFLLRNRWDLGITGSGFMAGNIDAEDVTYQTSLGLMSKVYFPIKRYRLSPNIGAELSWNKYTIGSSKSSSISPFLLTGISWYVGNGSFDLGVRTGKQYIVMIGYTFIPRLKSTK